MATCNNGPLITLIREKFLLLLANFSFLKDIFALISHFLFPLASVNQNWAADKLFLQCAAGELLQLLHYSFNQKFYPFSMNTWFLLLLPLGNGKTGLHTILPPACTIQSPQRCTGHTAWPKGHQLEADSISPLNWRSIFRLAAWPISKCLGRLFLSRLDLIFNFGARHPKPLDKFHIRGKDDRPSIWNKRDLDSGHTVLHF